VNTESEDNEFTLEGLKPRAASAGTTASKAKPRPVSELFARITKRHCALLLNQRGTSVIIFNYLMMHSVKMYNHPFELPVDYLTRETGMGRHAQLRALRFLARTGIIKIAREGRYSLPLITIPGTTKVGCNTN
jgi:hypothetical protein